MSIWENSSSFQPRPSAVSVKGDWAKCFTAGSTDWLKGSASQFTSDFLSKNVIPKQIFNQSINQSWFVCVLLTISLDVSAKKSWSSWSSLCFIWKRTWPRATNLMKHRDIEDTDVNHAKTDFRNKYLWTNKPRFRNKPFSTMWTDCNRVVWLVHCRAKRNSAELWHLSCSGSESTGMLCKPV